MFNRARLSAAGLTERDLLIAGHYCRATIFENQKSINFLIDKGVPPQREKAQSETIGVPGAFLVPVEIENSIISLRDVSGILRRYAGVLNMGSDERHWPRRVNGVTANFTAEAAAIAESALTWDDVALSAKKIAAFVRVSNELYEDEIVDLGAWFIEEISAAFAAKEDQVGFVGAGGSSDGGIRGICQLLIDGSHNAGKAAATATHSSLDKIDGADIASLMALLPGYAWPNARWYTSGVGVGLCFARLAAASGANIGVAPDGLSFMGFPISIVPSMPGSGSQVGKIVIAFGDLRQAVVLGSRRGVTVRNSGERFLESDQTAVRGTERFDVVAANLGDNTTAGPIVGLVATA
jgi:HK97 family phage major capsid protein